MEKSQPMSFTDFVRLENDEFVAEVNRARTAADELLQETAGPWTGGDFLEAIQERAGVRHNPAMYVEDELISSRAVHVRDGYIVRASGDDSSPPPESARD